MRAKRVIQVAFLGVSLAGLASVVGCGSESSSPPASPIVSADSEAARKALAEDERFRERRQREEAKSRQRFRSLPQEDD
jgi:hypothetical protein